MDTLESLVHSMDKKQAVEFAARVAESVLWIHDERFPDESGPRAAVEMALAWARGPGGASKIAEVLSDATYDAADAAFDALEREASFAANAAWNAVMLICSKNTDHSYAINAAASAAICWNNFAGRNQQNELNLQIAKEILEKR